MKSESCYKTSCDSWRWEPCVSYGMRGHRITHPPSLLLPHGRCCPPVSVTPSWKRKRSGSHTAPYKVAYFFTTYIKINEVVLVSYLRIQTYLFQEKQWKILLNGFNMGEDKFGSFQAHELTFKIMWIFWQEYHDRTVQFFDQFSVL